MAQDEDGEAAAKPIEEIRVGDKVYSIDPATGKSGFKEVVQLYVKETAVLIHITVSGEEITTTPDHPFRVGSIWISAKDLRAGDLLTLADGTKVAIDKIQTETLAEPVTVYNFEVADFHTYYVGNSQVLVHNDCIAGGEGNPGIGSGGNKKTVAGETGLDPIDVHLKYKQGWTAEQMAEADAKLKALSEATTKSVGSVDRSGTSARTLYKKVFGNDSIKSGYDIDHIIDLQLGGSNTISNLAPLNQSVNRSLGVQIKNAIKKYPVGTVFGNFTIE